MDGRQQVALVGDSYTDGIIDDASIPPEAPANERLYYQGKCFAALIEKHLSAHDITTARIGFGGSTSRDWDPNDFRSDDLNFFMAGQNLFSLVPAANLVVVMLGTNDATGFLEKGGPVPPEEYGQHLLDIAITLRARGVQHVVLVTPPTPASWQIIPEFSERMDRYAELARRLSEHVRGIHLVDVASTYPENEWFGEGIHPTIAGHQRIADAIMGKVHDLLKLDERAR
jgi:lysophospholipase L1-like esterase